MYYDTKQKGFLCIMYYDTRIILRAQVQPLTAELVGCVTIGKLLLKPKIQLSTFGDLTGCIN